MIVCFIIDVSILVAHVIFPIIRHHTNVVHIIVDFTFAFGNGIFAALLYTFNQPNCVITSTDGITWKQQTIATNTTGWSDIIYANGQFVGVGDSTTNNVITSPDGITWTLHTAPGTNWQAVAYGNGLYVAVSYNLISGIYNTMYSVDAVTWTLNNTDIAAGLNDIIFANGKFVAVGGDGNNFGYVETSTDGRNWTASSISTAYWQGLAYGNGLYVAVAGQGYTSPQVATSPDGVTWTNRTTDNSDKYWADVVCGNGLFVAISSSQGNNVMTSVDGITWTTNAGSNTYGWFHITYANGLYVAVAQNGSATQQIMTSGIFTTTTTTASNGLTVVNDDVRLGGVMYANTLIDKEGHAFQIQGDGRIDLTNQGAALVHITTTLALHLLQLV